MSWELCACLDRFGLKERWVKILKNLEIESIETLERRGKVTDLYNVLEKAATDEEKAALPLLFSKECKEFVKQIRVFARHLKKKGLEASKWQRVFAEEGILTLQDLHKWSGNLNKFAILNNNANAEEAIILQQMMDISSEVAGEHEVEVILDSIGLESKYWLSIFKTELHIAYPALLNYLTSADCQILVSKARHENETSVIKKHFMSENYQSFAVRWQRDKDNLKKYFAEVERLLFELENGLTLRQVKVTENETQSEEKEETSDDFRIASIKEGKETTSDVKIESTKGKKEETSDDFIIEPIMEEKEETSDFEIESTMELNKGTADEVKEGTSDEKKEGTSDEEKGGTSDEEKEGTSDEEKEGTFDYFKIESVKENLCVLLQISRKDLAEFSVSPTATVKILKQHYEDLKAEKETDADVSIEHLMEKTSDGLLLRGMYLADELEKLVPRRKVLKTPSEFSLTESTIYYRNITEKFSSEKAQENFSLSLKNTGYSMTVAERAENEKHLTGNNSVQNDQSFEDQSSCIQARYIVIPVAKATFETKGFLMEDVLEELKKIEDEAKISSKNEMLNKCNEFFDKHGTHVNTGQVHFGGICEMKVKYCGNIQNNHDIWDEVLEEVMEEVIRVGWKHRNASFSVFDASESIKDKYNNFDFENLCVSLETVGGPTHTSSFFQWKLGLAGTNSSLAVIDRGFQAKGIWEILEHYHEHFQCFKTLAAMLLSAWECKTGLKTGVYPNSRYLFEVPQRVRDLCHFVENCISSADFPENCEQYIIYINNEKEELTMISRYPNLWCSIVRENHCIQKFFHTVLENITHFSKNSIQAIQFLLSNLLDGLDNSDFPHKDAIIQWCNECKALPRTPSLGALSVLNNFVSTVRKFVIPRLEEVSKDYNKSTQAFHDGHVIGVTHDFIIYACSLLEKLLKFREYHALNLMQLLLFCIGYDIGTNNCNRLLSEVDVNTFLQGLEDKSKLLFKYSSQCVIKAECYLLSVALEIDRERPTNSDTDEKISHIINVMKPSFCKEVKKLIDENINSPTLGNSLQSSVQSVLHGLHGTVLESENHSLLGAGLEKVMKVNYALPALSEVPPVRIGTSKVASRVERKQGESVLEQLGLLNYFPSKITPQLIMQTPPAKLEKVQDIPWYVLQKLLLLDYRGRDASCSSQDTSQKMQIEQEDADCNIQDEDFINDIFAGVDMKTEVIGTKRPNPMDVLVALFLCSSNFLRQVLAEKMYRCQLSIPILLPDRDNGTLTLLIWALRTLVCEYELQDGSVIETPIVSHKLPTVSFLRLGKVSRSKSKLLNDIIGNQGHNTFFHRDCANGITHPVLADGLADVAWFLPSKKVKSRINDAVTYINLHGDAKCFLKQCGFLVSISDILVVMVSTEELERESTALLLKEIITCNKKLVLIITKTQDKSTDNYKDSFAKCFKAVGQELKKQTIILDFDNNGNKTASAISSETLEGISKALPHGNASCLEESVEIAVSLGFLVDENGHECSIVKILADEVFNIIDDNVAVVKSEMLPLQGDLWHEWGKLEKKEHRRDGGALSEHYAARLHEEKKALRHKQLLVCNNPPRLLETFISKLLLLPGILKLYFLKWLAVFLDGTSRRTLPCLMKEYRMKWNELNECKSKRNNIADSYMMKLQNDLCKIEENLALSSLGLEHIMREVGQAYEAVASLTDRVVHGLQKTIHKLPRVMAELMMLGHPLEIMDGDSSHVPLLWVTAVLRELEKITGDKKLFVLSVLGIQSSGKSTLLNTMFGLQFTVSAGRCTRGVYAQLVPIPKDADNSCDYILVLDTEGLRAPELGSTKHQHDNELATLVIGLGDLTIINIKGENPTEMQDVLQIVVHALLRMRIVNKNLKLQPSCFFIHQNVGALNAAEKMIFGQQKLLENLDQMTAAAADQENARGINSFKEVIDFNVEKNVWYFSDLWQGDPPMAPANPGYSEKVWEVKMSILQEVQKRSPTSLSNICTRIKDLWKGVLAENFVFSFKNSLELRAYGSVESTLTDLSWSLQNDALKWLNGARNRVQSSEKELDMLENSLSCEFRAHFNEVYEKVQNKLANFFESDDDKAILEQWKANSMIKLKDRKEDAIRITMTSLRNDIEVRKAEMDQISETEMYKDEIQGLAKKLALELQEKGNVAEREIEKRFDLLWNDWMKCLSEKPLHCHAYDIKGITEVKLYEMLPNLSLLLRNELKLADLSSQVETLHGNFVVCAEHIINKKKYLFFDKLSPEKCLQNAYEVLKDLFADIDDYMKSLQGSNFNPSQAVALIKKTCDMVEGVNADSNYAFKFTSLFKAELVVFVSRYAVSKFQKLQDDYLREIDPKTTVERNYKEQLLKFCKSKYLENKNEKIVADMLSTCLMDAVNKAVLRDMARELADDVRRNVPCLHTKGDLLNAVQRDMLKLRKFKEFWFYLFNIKQCLRKWIQTYTDKYVFDKERNGVSRYFELASLKIQLHFNNIKKEIDMVDALLTHDQGVHKKNFQLWLKMFHEGIKEKLPLPESNLSLFAKEHIEDEVFFKRVFSKNLDSAKNYLEDKAKSLGKEDLQSQNISVYSLLEGECLGCCEQCPFCRSPCSLTVPGHEVQHSALQHYPQGAGSYISMNDEKLVIENCSALVSSNDTFRNQDTEEKDIPYKEYRKFYPDWNIQCDASMEASLYWKWFMANYAFQLARAHRAVLPDIPHAWTLITPAEAEASLN